jgi:hypothetical protein
MGQQDNWRIDHTGLGVADIRKSAQFHDAALAAVGLRPLVLINKSFRAAANADDPELAGVGYGVDYPIFWIDLFHPHGIKQHTAMRAFERDPRPCTQISSIRASRYGRQKC